MTSILEILEFMLPTKAHTFLTCTSDQCRCSTTKHTALTAEEREEKKLHGMGWYQCISCGTVRQSNRHSGRYLPPKDLGLSN